MKKVNITIFKTAGWCCIALLVVLLVDWQWVFAQGPGFPKPETPIDVAGGAGAVASAIIGTIYKVVELMFDFLNNTIGSNVLDLSLDALRHATTLTVLEFSTIVAPTESGIIQDVWVFFRDVANLIIVALFITIAVGIVFSHLREKPGWYSKATLVRLLIAALLVNFSGFFVLFIYDVSNLFALLFQQQSGLYSLYADNLINPNLHQKISLSGASSGASAPAGSTAIAKASILFHLFSMITKFALAASFFYLIILFFERFFVAILVLITSPIAVIALFVGGDGKNVFGKFKIWWVGKLQSTALMPVIIFFLLWFVFKITELMDKILNENLGNSPYEEFIGSIFLAFLTIFLILHVISLFNKIQKALKGGVNLTGRLQNLRNYWRWQGRDFSDSVGKGQFHGWTKRRAAWLGKTSVGKATKRITKEFVGDVRSIDQGDKKKGGRSLKDRHILFKSSAASGFFNRHRGGKKDAKTQEDKKTSTNPRPSVAGDDGGGGGGSPIPKNRRLEHLQESKLALPYNPSDGTEKGYTPPTGKQLDEVSGDDYHAILGTSNETSPEKMRDQYKLLMNQHHPDRIGEVDGKKADQIIAGSGRAKEAPPNSDARIAFAKKILNDRARKITNASREFTHKYYGTKKKGDNK